MIALPKQVQSKTIQRFLGICLVLGFSYLLFSRSAPILNWMEIVENKGYDLQVRGLFRPLPKNPSVVILTIDDKSIKAEGRIPWPRDKMAALTNKLKALGAKVIAFDFMFPQEEVNIAQEIIEKIGKKGASGNWQEIESEYNYDAIFAQSLKGQTTVLGMYLGQNIDSIGILPFPLFKTTASSSQAYIPEKNSYIGNIPILQKAASDGGFIDSNPDSDGVIRYAPLIFKYKSGIYGSLALTSVWHFLDIESVKLIAKDYDSGSFLEGLQMGERMIPLDPLARILVPYRGGPFSFPYFSTTDLLHDKIPRKEIEGKLVFIGVSATGGGDLVSTPLSSVFAGVEIHATIAQGIIDQYLPFKPGWAKGVSVAILLFIGLPFAFILPRVPPLYILIIYCVIIATFLILERFFWVKWGLVFSFFFSNFVISLVFLFNLIYGYILEAKQKRYIKSIFGQYVSSDHIDQMLKEGGEFALTGESKELSVLFSDIRGFTSLSESMTAIEVKTFLNAYFNEMTRIVFDEKGTIDKYIGDAVMAFWGAPIQDSKAAFHAVEASLRMQEKLNDFNTTLIQEKKASVRIGVGIATGMMYVGDMGSKYRRSYTVLGDRVNLASRLEGLTKNYHVGAIVAEATQNATKDAFLYRKLDRVQVKGKAQVEIIYQPICKIESASEQLKTEIDLHHQALDAYAKGNWSSAKEIWSQLKEGSKWADLYSMYLERMATSPPPSADWNGVQKFETK